MIVLDYRDRRPIYEQVVEKLQELMMREILVQHEQLPSVRSLATDLAINPNTIQRAYTELERQGYIYSVKGKGSFVSENSRVKELKRNLIYEQLELAVRQGKCIGIGLEEILTKVRDYYGAGGIEA